MYRSARRRGLASLVLAPMRRMRHGRYACPLFGPDFERPASLLRLAPMLRHPLVPMATSQCPFTPSQLKGTTLAQAQANRMTFWSCYRHSARTDGALGSAPRRVLGFSISIVLLTGWYLSMSRAQPKVTEIIWRLGRLHPFCFLGIVLAFSLMSLLGSALEYLAYSVHHAQGVHLKWVLFGIGEDELRRRYEEVFGKDRFFKAPTLCAGLSILVFASSGLTLVFTSR